MMRFEPLLAFALAAIGCAEMAPPPVRSPPSTPTLLFPTRAEVSTIPARSASPEMFGTKDVAVEEWNVESLPLPSVAAYDDPSTWGGFLRELMASRGDSVVLSPAMRCAAAEIARFRVKNGALPVERLRRFILARCGGDTPNLSPFVWYADAPPGVSDADIALHARDALAKGVETVLAHGHHLVGLAAARNGRRVSVALAIGEDEARLEPSSRSVDANRRVTLRGTARGEYAQIVGYVNAGPFGYAKCAPDLTVHVPAFAVTCALAPGDSFDWVEVLGMKRGRVMLHPVADVLIYDGDGSTIQYHSKPYGEPAPVASPPALTSALVAQLNVVRQTAKLPPLILAPKQSVENERLAGTLLGAALGQDDDAADKAALGLLAGWDIDGGMIRGGHFFLGVVGPTNDAQVFLESAAERPSGRMTLFDPDANVIAVGPSVPDGLPGLGAAITTYALFGSADHTSDETAFVRHLTEVRAAHGLPQPARMPTPASVRKIAARAGRDDVPPLDALREMLSDVTSNLGVDTKGYVLETNDPSSVEVSEVFLRRSLPIIVAITHHRAPGAAWGQYVVFAVLPGDASSQFSHMDPPGL
jgi:hypothetical protein